MTLNATSPAAVACPWNQPFTARSVRTSHSLSSTPSSSPLNAQMASANTTTLIVRRSPSSDLRSTRSARKRCSFPRGPRRGVEAAMLFPGRQRVLPTSNRHEEGRYEIERDRRRQREPADHSERQGLLHLAAGAESQGEWQQPEQCAQ